MSDVPQLSSSFLSARRRAFSVVLAIELWERFGYYGMQAVLTIFMVEQLRMHDADVNLMQGALGFLMYSLPVLGGVIGDRVAGTRPTLVAGGIGLTAGYGLLAVSLIYPHFFLPSLTLIALSNGLFKPNAGALVRRIYSGDGTALDAAFTLYYMSINVGSTVSMLLMPWLQQHYGPVVAFASCALGLVAGLGYYAARSRDLRNFFSLRGDGASTLENVTEVQGHRRLMTFAALAAGLLVIWGVCTWVLESAALVRWCIGISSVGMFVLWGALYTKASLSERAGLLLTYILCLQTMAYQVFYQQMQTSLTLFALRAVSGEYRIAGHTLFTMSAGQFQALNPIAIMLFSPLLAWLYQRWAKNGKDVSLSVKMLCGYACVGSAFLLWWWSAKVAVGLVSPWIMVLGYFVMSLGELLTIGLGMAVVARYAPARISAILMGTLFLLWGVGMYVGSLVANMAAVPAGEGQFVGAILYAPLFQRLFWACVILCGILVLLLPVVRRLDKSHMNVMGFSDSSCG